MEGNIQRVKESLEQQMRNNIGTCDKTLEGDLNIIGDKRFIVSTGKLKELKGTHCSKLSNDGSICDKKLDFSVNHVASVCTLTWHCSNNHSGNWVSSEEVCVSHNSPVYANNIQMAACILLSGNNFSKITLFCEFLNLKMPGDASFCRIQRFF